MRLFLSRAKGAGRQRAPWSMAARSHQRRRHSSLEQLEARTLLAITSTTPVPVTVGETSAFTGEVLHFTANDAGPFSASIIWGDSTVSPATSITPLVGGGFAVNGAHSYAEDGPYAMAVAITDAADNTTASGISPATVKESLLNQISLPITVPEGTALINVAVANISDPGSPDPPTAFTSSINWGDGTSSPGTVTAVPGVAGSYSISGSHTYAPEESSSTVTVTTFENVDPSFTALSTSTATVSDAALSATSTQPVVPAAGTLKEGSPFSGAVATFTDANADASVADVTALIDWGDGTGLSLGTFTKDAGTGVITVNGQHTYKQDGSFSIRVAINDDGGSKLNTSTSAIISDLSLTGAAARPVQAVEGADTGLVSLASFVDPDPNSTPHDWSAVINWGDGSRTEAATLVLAGGDPASGGNLFKILANHIYAEEFAVPPPATGPTVTITDVDTPANAPMVIPLNITVVDAPLSSQGASVQATEGIAFTAQIIATFTDSNPGADFTDFTMGGSVSINWGDSNTLETVAVSNLAAHITPNGVHFTVTGGHTYAEEGSYKVTVTAFDRSGSLTIAHSEADVADAGLSLSTIEPISSVNSIEGVQLSDAVATFFDPNPDQRVSDFRASIDWGDGTPQSAGTIIQRVHFVAGPDFVVTGTHTYSDSGVNGGTGHFQVTVYITDEGGSKLTVVNPANVADVPIVLRGQLNPASDSGQSHFDAITNVNQPNFFGTSEPFSTIKLFAQPAGGTSALVGQTEADSSGAWSITSNALADGSYTINVMATDRFGFTTAMTQLLPNAHQGPLLIDTIAPRITDVFFNRLNGEVDVVFQDERSGMNLATLLDSANYYLAKLRSPRTKFLMTNINVTPPASPTSPVDVTLVFNGGKPLRGGFYEFRVRDSTRGPSTVQDVAGNSLDGEFYGTFPSGNGIPGGDFVAMLDAVHNKIFAPQTTVGKANPANGGQGGLPVGAVHSGHFTPVVPRGGGSFFPAKHQVHQAKVVASHPHGPRRQR